MTPADFSDPDRVSQHAMKVARAVYDRLGANDPNSRVNVGGFRFAPIANIGVWLDNNLSSRHNEILKLRFGQTQFRRNTPGPTRVARDFPWLATADTADHGIAPVINIRNVLMGTDKWEHFFQQGWWLFDRAQTDRGFWREKTRAAFSRWLEGFPSSEGERHYFPAIATQCDRAIDGQRGYFGTYSTGVASTGDVNANEEGYHFYRRLAREFERNPRGTPFVFSVDDYRYSGFNEEHNPGYTDPRLITEPGLDRTREDWDRLRRWMAVEGVRSYPLFDPNIRP
jgi:hypothetical protein